jgi:hypothetical protein
MVESHWQEESLVVQPSLKKNLLWYHYWMEHIENVVGVGGIRVHPLWMDAIEKVSGWVENMVRFGGLRVHPLWMDEI